MYGQSNDVSKLCNCSGMLRFVYVPVSEIVDNGKHPHPQQQLLKKRCQ